jgi:hypothetical protein
MSLGHGTSLETPPQPCWHCIWFKGLLYQGSAAACSLPNGPRVRSAPLTGCSAWEREPGVDDEPDPPLGLHLLPQPVGHRNGPAAPAAAGPVPWAP